MKYITIPEHNLGNYQIPEDCKREVCVDIGANVGSFTSTYADQFEKIYFYEPYKPCFQIVSEKTSDKTNVYGFNEAVYKEDGAIVSIVSHDNKHAGSNAIKTDSVNNHWNEELHQIKTVSLPTVLSRAGGHINYLKCDCETSEYYFLYDQDLSNIDYIAIEIHWQMGKDKFDRLIEHISKTHNTNSKYLIWAEESNIEVLFRNKKMQ